MNNIQCIYSQWILSGILRHLIHQMFNIVSDKLGWYTEKQNLFVLLSPTKTRNNFVSTKQEVEKLMNRIRSADQDYKPPGQWTMEGFLYIQEKRESYKLGSQTSSPSLYLSLCLCLSLFLSMLPCTDVVFLHYKYVWSSSKPLWEAPLTQNS